MHRLLSLFLCAVTAIVLPVCLSAQVHTDNAPQTCWQCTSDPSVGTASCNSGGAYAGCSVSCGGGLCACATGSVYCSTAYRSPDGSISAKVTRMILHSGASELLARNEPVEHGHLLIRNCDEAIVLRDYSLAKVAAIHLSTRHLVL